MTERKPRRTSAGVFPTVDASDVKEGMVVRICDGRPFRAVVAITDGEQARGFTLADGSLISARPGARLDVKP